MNDKCSQTNIYCKSFLDVHQYFFFFYFSYFLLLLREQKASSVMYALVSSHCLQT